MKKRIRGIAALLLTSILLTGALAACGAKSDAESVKDNTSTETSETTDTATTNLTGTLSIAGSTSMEKLSNVAGELFMMKYPGVMVTSEFIGSSAGVEAVLAGTVDIGNASRGLKDSEKTSGAVENIVAIDGIAVITDKANVITDLSKDQLIKIYTGEIAKWNEIGGADLPIVVIGRESGSGTRGAFEELLELEDLCKYSNEINSTGGVMAKVASTPGAIGYVSLDVIDQSVRAVKLEGVEPTPDNIKAGSYFLSRPFVMATIGEVAEQSEIVQAFFNFMKSEEGKDMIKEVGLITVD